MPEPIVGTPAAGTPAPAPVVATTPSPEPTPSPNPPEPAPGTKGGDDWEKRFKGIQSDLATERKARQQYQQQLQAQETRYKAEIEAERNRVRALAGVNVASPEEAEAEDIRQRLSKVATPDWLLKQLGLTKEEIAEFKSAKEDRARLSDIEKHYWGKHGQNMTKQVATALAKEYGGDLTERQIKTITRAYVLQAQEDPEFLRRHEDGDESLVTDFAKEWLEDWFEPARRKITATEATRFRPVPDGKGRSIVNHGEKKIDVNDNDAVMDFISKGRTFTGRR